MITGQPNQHKSENLSVYCRHCGAHPKWWHRPCAYKTFNPEEFGCHDDPDYVLGGTFVDYSGPDPSIECAYPGCTRRLRYSVYGLQFCSKKHRDLAATSEEGTP